jgi:hypothetical protein
MKLRDLKLLSAAVGIAAFIATPAFAQSYTPEFGTANIVPNAISQDTATSAFAQVDPIARPFTQTRNGARTNVGILEGVPAGTDPYAYHDALAASEAN